MKRLALAAAVALIASGALAQTQPVPTAIAPGGQTMNSTPSAIIVAPAGGAGGKGTVVAPDHPLPVTGSFTLPSGAATAAKQDTGNTSAASIDGKLSTTNTTLGTLATAAAQSTANASLGSIDGKVPAKGQTAKSGSTPVTIASDQYQATSTPTAVTIATAQTFQVALSANSARKGCTVQNTSSDLEYVFFGPNASAALNTSVQLQPGQAVSCSSSALILTDNISITSQVQNGATAVVVTQ